VGLRTAGGAFTSIRRKITLLLFCLPGQLTGMQCVQEVGPGGLAGLREVHRFLV
jgi:hypothetical protein